MKKYECQGCLLVVEEIPKFKKGECQNDIQHHFTEIEVSDDN